MLNLLYPWHIYLINGWEQNTVFCACLLNTGISMLEQAALPVLQDGVELVCVMCLEKNIHWKIFVQNVMLKLLKL